MSGSTPPDEYPPPPWPPDPGPEESLPALDPDFSPPGGTEFPPPPGPGEPNLTPDPGPRMSVAKMWNAAWALFAFGLNTPGSGSNTNSLVGLTAIVVGIAPLVFKELQYRRYERMQGQKRRIDELERQLAAAATASAVNRRDIDATAARVATESGRTDAVVDQLRGAGVFRLPAAPPTRRVLVIEDSSATARLMGQFVTRLGLAAIHASCVDDAIRQLQATPIDAVLLDLLLVAGEDGLDVLRWLRANSHGARVIVITAASDPDRVAACKDLKPDYYLQKPVDVAALEAALTAPDPPPPPPAGGPPWPPPPR